jgi:predicted nucleic acid-binding Zn ribbon protein
MSDRPDIAVDYFYKVRALLTGQASKEVRRREKSQRHSSKPFDEGRSPKKLGSSIEELIKGFGWQGKVAEGDLFANWKLIVGDRVAEFSYPEDFSKGILTIRCKSTAWATQLRLMSKEIMQKVSERTPDLEVKEIKVLGPQAPSFKRGLRSVPGRGPRDTFG